MWDVHHYYSAHINCPIFFLGFFPPLPGYFPLSAGKNFFFPSYDSFRRLSTEASRRARREATINISAPAATVGSDGLPRRHLSSGVDALRTVALLRPRRPSPPHGASLQSRYSRRETSIKITVVDAMPSSPNHIVRGAGRTKEGKQVKLTARGAQGRRSRKRSFSRDDRLARDGARMHTGSMSPYSSRAERYHTGDELLAHAPP
jgi:hypothetical protein